jgi:ADP-ribosylglycohydrolase
MELPSDYLERVYAGVLGKLIGVYLGRPFENWTYQRIMKDLGPIEYYVNERLDVPLVVTDDDVGGTFTFVRALDDHGASAELSSEDIGRTWLNYLIENRSILWWGGNGNSTEHTAWLNLKRGIAAPASGSIGTNGKVVAEQIGAQIFVDGWGMVAPGQPELAAKLAGSAGRVSHDGDAVHAAMLWAAMEAEAFGSSDINRLLDIGLKQIPVDCLIARLIGDIRSWHEANPNWHTTRQLIEDNYGYDAYIGNCHVVPNHALMIMTVLYAPHDFQRAQMIVNTSGWDTDCNAGNVGCLLGLMNGLATLDAGPDWRGPLADRMLISSADGGNSINDAVRQAYYLTGLGRSLAGQPKLTAPKDGAMFHFSLPGSVQGFRIKDRGLQKASITNVESECGRALAIDYVLSPRGDLVQVMTPVFAPPEVIAMRTYELMASPLVYPGQKVRARVVALAGNRGAIDVRLCAGVYDEVDQLRLAEGPSLSLGPGQEGLLEYDLPDLDGQPIGEIGLSLGAGGHQAHGRLVLDYLSWDGSPSLTLRRPTGGGSFWHRAWVNGADMFPLQSPATFRIVQNRGEGLVSYGTRQWTNYRVACDLVVALGSYVGVALRVQGLRRYYGVRILREGRLQVVRVRDEVTRVLAECDFSFEFHRAVAIEASIEGHLIRAVVDGVAIEAIDAEADAFLGGAMGLFIYEGAMSTDFIEIGHVSRRLL